MILEEAPHRISNHPASWLEDEVALKKRRDGFRKDYPTRRRGSVASALVTAGEAEALLNISNLPTFLRSEFQTMGISDDSAQASDVWRDSVYPQGSTNH